MPAVFRIRKHAAEFRAVLDAGDMSVEEVTRIVETVAETTTDTETPDEPRASRIDRHTRDFVLQTLHHRLNHAAFEEFTADLLRAVGHQARVTAYSQDGGMTSSRTAILSGSSRRSSRSSASTARARSARRRFSSSSAPKATASSRFSSRWARTAVTPSRSSAHAAGYAFSPARTSSTSSCSTTQPSLSAGARASRSPRSWSSTTPPTRSDNRHHRSLRPAEHRSCAGRRTQVRRHHKWAPVQPPVRPVCAESRWHHTVAVSTRGCRWRQTR
jgi:hypothetical protein